MNEVYVYDGPCGKVRCRILEEDNDNVLIEVIELDNKGYTKGETIYTPNKNIMIE